ncbi:hypothetical protein WJX74_004855 [Apatococcus lobatus]|uniref:K Homology domain-containing protein n=1 Tax=Apatococcus lobatus TaxID=904363 RepID=A0AAW1S2E9_9CHLO
MDRVMLVAGTIRQVSSALYLMLEKRRMELESMGIERGNKDVQLRLLVPAALCGIVIGKQGATIRGFAEKSGARITLTAQNMQPPGVLERLVRIVGELDASGETGSLKALTLVANKMLESPNYSRVTRSSVSYGRPGMSEARQNTGTLCLSICCFFQGYDQDYRDRPDAVKYAGGAYPNDHRMVATVPVPDSRIGAMIGQKGEVISQLKSLCDVEIRISNREDFLPGTRNRKVTISGTAEAIGITQALIRQKLRAAPLALAL